MNYTVLFSKLALKNLSKINEPFYSNIKQAVRNLAINPRPIGYIKLKGKNAFRIRVGVYRVIYKIIDNELIVDIITIGHRKDVY